MAEHAHTTPAPYMLGRHPRRPDHRALLTADGTLQNTFAIDATRAEIADTLARRGLVLHVDDTVTRAADAVPTRRGVLSGLALASAAILVTAPAIAAGHPDAHLLALVADLEATQAELDESDRQADLALNKGDETYQLRLDAWLNHVQVDKFWPVAKEIATIRARTPEGIAAKAKVARMVWLSVDRDPDEDGHMPGQHMFGLIRDILGEG